MKKRIAEIAARHCKVATLETQKVGSKDFHEIAVWQLKAALEAAYTAGVFHGHAVTNGIGTKK